MRLYIQTIIKEFTKISWVKRKEALSLFYTVFLAIVVFALFFGLLDFFISLALTRVFNL